MAKVVVILAEGFEEIEAVTIIDVLRRADIEVTIAGVVGSLHVKGGHHIELVAEEPIGKINSDDYDMIILPGGWGGTKVLAEHESVQRLLKEFDEKEKEIGAICAAPYALSKAGLIKGPYTCYPGFEDQIGNKEWHYPNKDIVKTGRVTTSRGPGTAMAFALAIVQNLAGEEKFQQMARALLVQ